MTPHLTIIAFAALAAPALGDTSADKLHAIAHFFGTANVVSGPKLVRSTLSRGTKTTCFSITVKADPKDHTPGPWCPTSITDDADQGGIWLNDQTVHDVDGAFISNLARLYDDDAWQLYDPATGKVRVTDTTCEAAARPDVDPAYHNYCVQCLRATTTPLGADL